MNNKQLADIIRPTNFDEIAGQDHLFGPRGVVRRMIEGGRITNMIFYGPPGTGKTSAAHVIAANSDMMFHKLNATTASLSDVKDIISQTNNMFGASGILLYIDEIQYFNRKQQQSLLEYIEDGRVTLIASTTENPHFYIYNAIISRSSMFEFRPVTAEACVSVLQRAVNHLNNESGLNKTVDIDTLLYIARSCKGDVRHSVVITENAYFIADETITIENVNSVGSNFSNYNDDTHFDLLSCLQKSIRGSDPDAAVFYVAKLLALGELLSVCRRLKVIASEDIGLAYPQAQSIVHSLCASAVELGMPEARIPLANAAILLATAPKSNSAYNAINSAMADVEAGLGTNVPLHLQSPLFKGYKYPHDYPNHYVKQQYLPDDIKNKKYYIPGDNKNEAAAKAYADIIKK